MRVCRRCKAELPLSEFATIGTTYRSVACWSCSLPVPLDPDHRPAVRMRAWLAQHRRNGLPWSDERFEAMIGPTLTGLRSEEREGWPAVFHAHREAWRAAYERTEAITITTLTVDLIDD